MLMNEYPGLSISLLRSDLEEWSLSNNCILTPRQVRIILDYLSLENFKSVSVLNQISITAAKKIYKEGMIILRSHEKIYRHWVADKLLRESGIIVYASERDRFLNAPIHEFNLPERLVRILIALQCESIYDILELGKKEIQNLKNVGKISFKRLENLIKENNCEDLWNSPLNKGKSKRIADDN